MSQRTYHVKIVVDGDNPYTGNQMGRALRGEETR